MNGQQKIWDLLETQGVAYTVTQHEAVFTIEGLAALHLPHPEAVAKNLFLRDKKQRYYLLAARKDKRLDLKALGSGLGAKSLRFASPEELLTHLGLTPGTVGPLGAINDTAHAVQILLDDSFRGALIGVHPNDNTATVWLETEELVRVLQSLGSCVTYLAL